MMTLFNALNFFLKNFYQQSIASKKKNLKKKKNNTPRKVGKQYSSKISSWLKKIGDERDLPAHFYKRERELARLHLLPMAHTDFCLKKNVEEERMQEKKKSPA